ncbi:Response regulator receiver protein [uncultured Woeseiaceae bacterium]|uniref:Response regulator receiver protein n=1 Tax=uncultured Woeseiaceae bacterium TaxID=1983305 RepID=A0A7D9H3Z8_9GAMM|nr:Response regulator receiver protein [uncultured Woeseiaceae bacterium]
MQQRNGDTMVYVIDDDSSVRRAMLRLMRSAGLNASAFSSVDEFLAVDFSADNTCVVADVHMSGIDPLDLPSLLEKKGKSPPVIFITANDTPETRSRVRKAGAAGYFRKPVDGQALIDLIHWALSEQSQSTN